MRASHIQRSFRTKDSMPDQAPRAPGRAYGRALLGEIGLGWLVGLLLFALLTSLVARQLQQREALRMQQSRWQDELANLRHQLETDLALGFDLDHSLRAQSLLESTVVKDSRLRSLSVFDPSGRVLFDTDRGAVGEVAPAAWRQAAVVQPWRILGPDSMAIGMPLRTPFGPVAGHLVLTLSRPTPPRLLPLLATCFAPVVLAALLALVHARRFFSAALHGDEATGAQRLLAAEHRLARLEVALHSGSAGAP
jgi:hypothetical protein